MTTTEARPETHASPATSSGVRRLLGLVVALAVLVVVVLLSFVVGARDIAVADVLTALRHGDDGSFESIVVLEQRLPRTVAAVVAGLGLAVAGALMQAVTRNPLADPGILGVGSGAAFAVAVATAVLGITAPAGYLWFAFLGALLAAVVVFLVGSGGRGTVGPGRLVLAGVALAAVLHGITSAMLLADPEGYNAMRAWQAGNLADRGWAVLNPVTPFVLAGLVVALLAGRALNAVALGDDLASAQGANVAMTRVTSVAAITLLAGGATAIAGPIVFVGLMVPHAARWVVGPDQRWIAAYSAVLGPVLLLAADVLARVALRQGELPAGVVTAVLGAPVLVWLVRRTKVSGL